MLGKVLKRPLNKLRDKLFSKIHSNYLIYNTCWEDPRIDRQLLQINPASSIVMITSAGCNALDYLLDDPAVIHCIDLNARQNSLLELKKVLFKESDFNTLFEFFGKGRHTDYKTLYQTKFKSHLPPYAASFWDLKIKYFSPKSRRKSFYFYGTSGTFAFIFDKFLKTRRIMASF